MDRLGLLSRSVSCGSLASVAAAMLLAAVCTDAQAYGDRGVLRLQMGAVNQFAYYPDSDPQPTDSPTAVQRFYAEGKGSCRLDWDETAPFNKQLATLTAFPAVDGDPTPGFGATSIGVYDGPKGTPCSRVSAYLNESLTFTLGAEITDFAPEANAFDRLELDIEVKGNAEIWLTTHLVDSYGQLLAWPLDTYKLRSGLSIIPGESGPNVFNCSARSDSGPDSGPSDNCRWIINAAGQAFKIWAVTGEFSLEGGGDFAGNAFANNTVIHLTDLVTGTLACGGDTGPPLDIGGGVNGAQCQVASPPQVAGQHCNIFYAFRDITGERKGCEFMKGPEQQLVASMDITFPPEQRTDLWGVPPTFFDFPGAAELFRTDVCTGTLIDEDENGDPVNPTIDMTTLPVNDDNDAVPGNNLLDYACILEHTIEYLGDDSMQVSQTLLFWGDPAAIRF